MSDRQARRRRQEDREYANFLAGQDDFVFSFPRPTLPNPTVNQHVGLEQNNMAQLDVDDVSQVDTLNSDVSAASSHASHDSDLSSDLDLLSESVSISSFSSDVSNSCDFLLSSTQVTANKTPMSLKLQLFGWALDFSITAAALNGLLSILKPFHPELPRDSRSLKGTPRDKVRVRNVPPGVYHHFGLQCGIRTAFYRVKEEDIPSEIQLVFNIDGAPVNKTGESEFWPIMGKVKGIETEVFYVGVYHGPKKPESSRTYLQDFVDDLLQCEANGIVLESGRVLKIVHCFFICDIPARAFILGVKGHSSPTDGCMKCTSTDTSIGALRSNWTFRNRIHVDHHNSDSELERLHFLDIVKDLPVDPMHLVDAGITKRYLQFHVGRKNKRKIPNVTFSAGSIRSLDLHIKKIRKQMPAEFSRKLDTSNRVSSMKCTTLRTIVQYVGPVILKPFLSRQRYRHLLCLHLAIKLLASSETCIAYNEYAGDLLKTFVSQSVELLGRSFHCPNNHYLLHLADDVKKYGKISMFSAYPFENEIRFLKNFVHKPENPLQQLVKRLHERDEFFLQTGLRTLRAKRRNEGILFKNVHWSGPLVEHCAGLQYKRVDYYSWILKVNESDSCVFLNDDSIVLIRNFIKCNDVGYIIGQMFTEKNDFYGEPFLSSSVLNIHAVNLSSLSELKVWRLCDVKYKAVKISSSLQCDDSYIVFPLKMEENTDYV